ncbi:MAG TPA: anhydro-N-acetylmuramic acid kinase [Candidatus Cybelea sp.]|nr:anhydro-N-acetylmuramic acid kinase [Candidatus Cybelea sp.]
MSGTSLDGIDAALVQILPRAQTYDLELVRFETLPFTRALHDELLAALPPNAGSVAAVAQLHRSLGASFAQAAKTVIGSHKIDFVASHGQTLWHDGRAHVTLQAGDAFLIREATGTTVCYDFRSADCAAGGHGAPLVARVDALLLGDAHEDRVALNLGGIANVTLLRKASSPEEAVAFDTGPGTMLLDAFVAERTAGLQHFDAGGDLARRGRVDESLLAEMLADEFFAAPIPKTTGRERFGKHFLAQHARLKELPLEDGAATLCELSAASIACAIRDAGLQPARVIAAGGGARNRTLIARLAERLAPASVELSDAMGLPVEAKEAMAFVVLGYETLRERAGNVPAATGAARPVVLGAIAPQNLRALLDRIDRECTLSS